MAQDRDRVVDHHLLRQLDRGRTEKATFSHLPSLFLVEAVLPVLQPQEHSRSEPGVDRQAGVPPFEAVVYLKPGVPVHDRRVLVQEGHRVIPIPGGSPAEDSCQCVQHRFSPFEPKLHTISPAPHVDTNNVRKATDAGEGPLTDPYIQRGVHRNRFASPVRVD